MFSIDATKLTEDYRKTVSDYLEKKQSYEAGIISFQGTEALHKAGVISNEEYLTARNRQKSDTLNDLGTLRFRKTITTHQCFD